MVSKRLAWIVLAALALLLLPALLLGGRLAGGERASGLPASEPVQQNSGAAAAENRDAQPAESEQLYVIGNDQLLIVDAATGQTHRSLPAGVLAADGKTLYSVEHGTPETTVAAIDTTTGETLRRQTLDRRYFLPFMGPGMGALGGLSPGGRWLVLGPRGEPEFAPWLKSDFVILDTDLSQPPQYVSLDGSFRFDAISDDGASLYLIEDVPVDPAKYGSRLIGQYHVRVYDVATAQLDPNVLVDKKSGGTVMQGMRLSSVTSPDGQWIYSLYLNESRGPFVHALNVSSRAAVCIFLPDEGKADRENQLLWTMALAPDGRTLYAANGGLGLVAEVDTQNFLVRRSAGLTLPEAKGPGLVARLARLIVPVVEAKRLLLGGAALSPDGETLFVAGREGLLVVDAGDLTLRAHHLADRALNSLALSPDGERLYAVAAAGLDVPTGQILRLDPRTGDVVAELPGTQESWGILQIVAP